MRVLIADDEPTSRRILAESVRRWGYDAIVCADGREALNRLCGAGAPPLAILDWMMPGLDGPSVCRELRELHGQPYTYIILLTSRGSIDDIVAGLEAGADDYVTKPFHPHELQVRLRAGQRIVDLQADLLAAQAALRHQALHDPLTSLWNRSALLEILARELSRSRRTSTPLAVLMADIDHFKDVNDTLGHAAGDVVLREVARRLLVSVRGYDTVARYGGEEFLCVLPGCGRGSAGETAERIRRAVAGEPIDTPDGPAQITISLGCVVSLGTAYADPDSVTHAADVALYRAKHAGRNCVELAV